jgi:hypothetical protein
VSNGDPLGVSLRGGKLLDNGNAVEVARVGDQNPARSNVRAHQQLSVERAFVFGFRFVMQICAGLALASAGFAWRMMTRSKLSDR